MSRRRPALSTVTRPDTVAADTVAAGTFAADSFTRDTFAPVHGAPYRDLDEAAIADPLACLTGPGHPIRSSDPQPWPIAWLASLLAGAVDATAGVDLGSVAETSADGAHTWATTLPVAEELDRCGAEWGEGPGAEALLERAPAGTVRLASLDGPAARRWPRWSRRARAAGVAATLSVVLPGGPPKRPAVLALHGPDPSSFGPASVSVARTFAAPVAVALHAASRVAGLERALESRDVIGQAKGLLMARHGIDDQAAFDQLVTISQGRNVRLAEIAARIVADGPGAMWPAPDARSTPPTSDAGKAAG